MPPIPPQATATTVLIIPLILNALSAPPPQTWAPMANSLQIVYQIAGQPHPSWLPPTDICRSNFGVANTTDPSVLLLLLVYLPGQPALHCGSSNSTKVKNRTAAWTSLTLDSGTYGVPRASEKPVCSNTLVSNISLDVGSLSLSNGSLLPMPHMITEDWQINDLPAGAPAFFGFVLCSSDGNGSSIPNTSSIFQEGRRYTRGVSRYRKRACVLRPRKLLGAHGTNLSNHRQFLIRKKDVVTAAGVAISSALLVLLCSVGLLCWCRRMSLEHEMPNRPAELCPWGPRLSSHRELAAATCGFSDEGKIGRGGFGPVYRGYLRDQGCRVAVKVLKKSSSQEQGTREFQAEVQVMTRLRHRNIVQLLGWCDGHGGLMLVYELVPNGSLDKHLYDSQRLLAWSERYKIALGVGLAILYLHTECEQCVLHGDVKPANIQLDHSCNAKLGDFGLARLVDHGTDSRTTQIVAGTPGYMDPELVSNQRPCAESDVFSFGVVLLEIACGKRPATRSNGTPVLLDWVSDMYRKNSILGVADQRLDGEFDDQQMRRVLVTGLWCAHHDQSQRPSIAQAMDLLRREDAELPALDQVMRSPEAVRSLEEIAYGDLSGEDSVFGNSSSDTAYHTSQFEVSARMEQ